MEINNIKKIVSVFLRTNPESIEDDTIIDNTVIQGSILIHRMISRINDLYDIEIDDYSNLKTFLTNLSIWFSVILVIFSLYYLFKLLI